MTPTSLFLPFDGLMSGLISGLTSSPTLHSSRFAAQVISPDRCSSPTWTFAALVSASKVAAQIGQRAACLKVFRRSDVAIEKGPGFLSGLAVCFDVQPIPCDVDHLRPDRSFRYDAVAIGVFDLETQSVRYRAIERLIPGCVFAVLGRISGFGPLLRLYPWLVIPRLSAVLTITRRAFLSPPEHDHKPHGAENHEQEHQRFKHQINPSNLSRPLGRIRHFRRAMTACQSDGQFRGQRSPQQGSKPISGAETWSNVEGRCCAVSYEPSRNELGA